MQTKRKTMIVAGAGKGIGAGVAITDAEHVRNAVARFDQVIDVSDADRALAFANLEKAANYYGVNLAETSWHDLPQKSRREAPSKGAVTRKR